ncbi:MAG: RHS repeat-associated core domain-containing protein [Planctomycetaceae bacterium]|jgi:RHS repeat-associated protein|nr:RHS repeat-associated core domain-containing protein [Planctomycetaceae bacterium]
MRQTTYNLLNVSLTYANGGLDRYGRIVNHSWVEDSQPLVHIVHGYDDSGNWLYRNDLVQSANSELYSYDNLGQIKTLNRGTLNTNQTAVTTVNHSESWNFDKTGNWSQYTKNGNVENRTHNAANELQGIATHDANGNMILMPGLKGKYDAWNRLIGVRDTSDNLIAIYEYNGLNQRIKKTVGATVTKSFFNEDWQELESQTGNEITSYAWGLRYIDDLILREKGEERLYSLADPNWNVVAVCNDSGDIQERYTHNAFGKRKVFDTDFTEKTETEFDWNRAFTGQVLDAETGLMLYRNRYYHTGLGRFVSRDSMEYDAEDVNIYRYVSNKAINYNDPFGFWTKDDCDIAKESCDEGCRRLPKNERFKRAMCWSKCMSKYAACLSTAEEAVKCYIVIGVGVAAGAMAACDGPLPIGDACGAALIIYVTDKPKNCPCPQNDSF